MHLLFFILNETLSIDREIKLQSFNMNQVVEGVKCKSARAKKCKATPIKRYMSKERSLFSRRIFFVEAYIKK